MANLYGRGGRLTAKNGGSRPGQYGRKRSVQAATVVDTATFLLLGLRPSMATYLLWQLLREFSRCA